MACADKERTRGADWRYIGRSMNAAFLTRERERELAHRWHDERDEAALHELVRAHGRLVVKMAARFRRYGLPMADLVQEGQLGLMQAAARFEPAREVRFSTYAAWWIRATMQEFVLRNWSIVRTGTTAAQKALFFNLRRLRARHAGETDGWLDSGARSRIADELGVRPCEVEDMEVRLACADRSLNAAVGESGEDEWQDFLADDRPSPEEEVAECLDSRVRSGWLATALKGLSPREHTIIRERRLRDDAPTLGELGKRLGISRERVRQIEQKAIEKLRAAVGEHAARPPAARPPAALMRAA